MVRKVLLATAMLAAIPAAVHATPYPIFGGIEYPKIQPMFPLPGGQQHNAKVVVTLRIFNDPGGYSLSTPQGLKKFCFMYSYEVEMWDSGGFPDQFIGGLTIPTNRYYLTSAPGQIDDGNPANDGPAQWNATTHAQSAAEIRFRTWDAVANGIRHGSRFVFTLYTDAQPQEGNLTFTGVHCFTQGACMPVALTAKYYVPTGPACGQQTQPQPQPQPEQPGEVGGACSHVYNVAQVYPALPTTLAGYPGPGCWTGGNTPEPFTSAVVPGVLCLETGADHRLDKRSFVTAACCASPAIQFTTLTKTIPGSEICPDLYAPQTIIQNGPGEIRTWWPLQFTQPGTRFRLELAGTCGAAPYREEYVWEVVANPESLSLLLDLFHNSPVGTTEIPCILGEDVYAQLKACYARLRDKITQLQASPSNADRRAAAQTAIRDCQALILMFALFEVSLEEVRNFVRFPTGNLAPTVVNPPPGIPAIAGIIDTLETPCACKMLVDLEFIAEENGLTLNPFPFGTAGATTAGSHR